MQLVFHGKKREAIALIPMTQSARKRKNKIHEKIYIFKKPLKIETGHKFYKQNSKEEKQKTKKIETSAEKLRKLLKEEKR